MYSSHYRSRLSDILRTMRHPILLAAILAALSTSCGSGTKPAAAAPAPKKAEAPKIHDEWLRFPKAHLIGTHVIEKELLGKAFMPGGTLASYKKGKTEYRMFLAQLPTAEDAALLLLDWKKALTDAKLVPSFGGYSG